jgi:hypothetical protein
VLEKQQPLDHGIWVLSGIPGEWTSDAAPERGFSRVKIFRGGHGAGTVTREYERGEFDYLVFEALYNKHYEGPQDFGGYSGGGLWQLLVKPDNGSLSVTQRFLSGVAFSQSDFKESEAGAIREITCHGRRSLYDVLISHVRSARAALS